MDIGLPEGNEAGIDTIKKIRAKGSYFTNFPIIALTANENKKLIFKTIEAGADDYLNKPAQEEQVTKIINKLLQEHPHAA